MLNVVSSFPVSIPLVEAAMVPLAPGQDAFPALFMQGSDLPDDWAATGDAVPAADAVPIAVSPGLVCVGAAMVASGRAGVETGWSDVDLAPAEPTLLGSAAMSGMVDPASGTLVPQGAIGDGALAIASGMDVPVTSYLNAGPSPDAEAESGLAKGSQGDARKADIAAPEALETLPTASYPPDIPIVRHAAKQPARPDAGPSPLAQLPTGQPEQIQVADQPATGASSSALGSAPPDNSALSATTVAPVGPPPRSELPHAQNHAPAAQVARRASTLPEPADKDLGISAKDVDHSQKTEAALTTLVGKAVFSAESATVINIGAVTEPALVAKEASTFAALAVTQLTLVDPTTAEPSQQGQPVALGRPISLVPDVGAASGFWERFHTSQSNLPYLNADLREASSIPASPRSLTSEGRDLVTGTPTHPQAAPSKMEPDAPVPNGPAPNGPAPSGLPADAMADGPALAGVVTRKPENPDPGFAVDKARDRVVVQPLVGLPPVEPVHWLADSQPGFTTSIAQAGPSGGFSAPASVPQGHWVPPVVAQITNALGGRKDGVTEFALSPEELGHVRLRLQPEAGNPERMVVMITFERPETLDLFRRHAGDLAEALRQAGFSGADIGFGHEGSGSFGSDRRQGFPSADMIAENLAETKSSPETAPRLLAGASLDLRL